MLDELLKERDQGAHLKDRDGLEHQHHKQTDHTSSRSADRRAYDKGNYTVTPSHKINSLTSPSHTTIYTQAVEREESSGESDVSFNWEKIDSLCSIAETRFFAVLN